MVVDGDRTKWLDKVRGPAAVLTLGVSSETYARANRAVLSGREITFVSAAPLARAAQEVVQDVYPALLHDVARRPLDGRRSLIERLSWRGTSLWWFTDISEKSALRGRLISDVYALALIDLSARQTGAGAVYVDSARASFRGVIDAKDGRASNPAGGRLAGAPVFFGKLLAKRAWWIARFALTRAVILMAGIARAPLSSTIFLTVHPLNWRRPYESEGCDRIYGRLPEVFAAWRTVGYLAWLSHGPVSLWRQRRAARAVFTRHRVVPLLALAKGRDLLAPLSPSHLAAVARGYAGLRALPPMPFSGYDISPLVRDEIARSLAAHELVADTVIEAATRRAAASGLVETIIHWGEWQPIEKAVWTGARDSRVTTVAVQHSAASPMFLNYRFVDRELAPAGSSMSRAGMPLPSLFATTGQYARDAAVAAGFPPGRARVCGPVRYPEIVRAAAKIGGRSSAREAFGIGASDRVALLITASKRTDNRAMLAAFVEAVADRRLTVIAKCHPFDRIEEEIETALRVRSATLTVRIVRDETSLGDLLPVADVMVGNSSASGLEALAAGVFPVFFHNPHVYDVNVMYSLRDSILLAADSAELRTAMASVFDNPSDLAAFRQRWPEALRYLLGCLDGCAEESLLDFVKSHTY